MTDLLNLAGWAQRQSSFRFDLLDETLTPLGTLDVEAYDANIENNINRKIKRTLSNVTIPPSMSQDVDTLRHRVKAWMITQDGVEWPLGVFLFAEANRIPLTGTNGFLNATFTDQLLVLDQGVTRSYSFGPNYSITTAIQAMLTGIIDNFIVDLSTASVRGDEAMVWPAGTSRLDIINDLCSVGGYYSLYFDNTGVARARLVPDLASIDPVLRYGPNEGEQRVHTGSIVLTDDLLEAPNRYIVTSTSMNNIAVSGFWDIPATSPNSKENRGLVVAHVTDQQGLASNEAATEAARAIGQSDYNTYSWATFDAALDPRHDTFDVVAWDNIKYREQSWSMDLNETGAHRHELRRIYSEV